jgi:hypothetical protein
MRNSVCIALTIMKEKFQVKKSGAHNITHDHTDNSKNPEK